MVLQKSWHLTLWKNLWEKRKFFCCYLLLMPSTRHLVNWYQCNINSIYVQDVETKCFRWWGLLVQEFLCSIHRNVQQRVTISQEYTFPVNRKKHMYLCIVLFTYVSLRKPEILLVNTTSLHYASKSKQIALLGIKTLYSKF